MKGRLGKLVGLVAAGAVLLQAGSCTYIAEAVFYDVLSLLVSQALSGVTT
jgi:hypothetical protein